MSYELVFNHVSSRQIFHTWQLKVSLITASLNYLLRANKEMEILVNAGQPPKPVQQGKEDWMGLEICL